MLNPSSARVLARPAGGSDAHSDFHDESAQKFKQSANWGSHNILSWSCTQLSEEDVERHIGSILPPTLTLMDDWEPPWRGRGVQVLQSWKDKVSAETMRRMGVDKLLINTLIHTLSLNSNPPLAGVFEVTLEMIRKTTRGKDMERAKRIEEVMDKGIIQAWMYAPSGHNGRAVHINIANQLILMCDEVDVGLVRWLKVIIIVAPPQYAQVVEMAADRSISVHHTPLAGSATIHADTGCS